MFNQPIYDVSLAQPMTVFACDRPLTVVALCQQLHVIAGTGGGAISFTVPDNTLASRFPNGVLVEKVSHRKVGLLAEDFDECHEFGILTAARAQMTLASQIATCQPGEVHYQTAPVQLGAQ